MERQALSKTLVRLRCQTCRFISPTLDLLETAVSCPSCGTSGEMRLLYPSLSALRLLDFAQHFHDVASGKHEDELVCVSKAIGKILGRLISPKAAYTAWVKINRTHGESRSSTNVVDTVMQFFGCKEPEAMDVLQAYFTSEVYCPEQTVVPILAVTLIEALVDGLLLDLKVKRRGASFAEAQREVRDFRTFDDCSKEFASIAGTNWPTAVQAVNKRFWDRWIYVHRKRNHFIHGNAYALGWETCEPAYELMKMSVGVFASLNNQFVICGQSAVA